MSGSHLSSTVLFNGLRPVVMLDLSLYPCTSQRGVQRNMFQREGQEGMFRS